MIGAISALIENTIEAVSDLKDDLKRKLPTFNISEKTSALTFLIVTALYLIVEIGYKGYAVSVVSQNDILKYELDILSDFGRTLSCFGFALVMYRIKPVGTLGRWLLTLLYTFFMVIWVDSRSFPNSLDDYAFLVILSPLFAFWLMFKTRLRQSAVFFAMFFMLMSLILDNVSRLASDNIKKTAASVNLYRNTFQYIDNPAFNGVIKSELSEHAQKTLVASLSFVLAGNEKLHDYINDPKIKPQIVGIYSNVLAQRYNTKQPYEEVFLPAIKANLKRIEAEYEKARRADFDPIFVGKYGRGHLSEIRGIYSQDARLRFGMPEQLKRNTKTLEELNKKGQMPSVRLVDQTIKIAIDHIKRRKPESLSYGLQHYSYENSRKEYFRDINNEAGRMLNELARSLNSKDTPLTSTEHAYLDSNLTSFKAYLLTKNFAEFLKTNKGFMINDAKVFYQIYNSSDSEGYAIFDRQIKRQIGDEVLESTENEYQQVGMTILVPLIMLMSTLAVMVNLIGLSFSSVGFARTYLSKRGLYFSLLIPGSVAVMITYSLYGSFINSDKYVDFSILEAPQNRVNTAMFFVRFTDYTGRLFHPVETTFNYFMLEKVEPRYIKNLPESKRVIAERKLNLKKAN